MGQWYQRQKVSTASSTWSSQGHSLLLLCWPLLAASLHRGQLWMLMIGLATSSNASRPVERPTLPRLPAAPAAQTLSPVIRSSLLAALFLDENMENIKASYHSHISARWET